MVFPEKIEKFNKKSQNCELKGF